MGRAGTIVSDFLSWLLTGGLLYLGTVRLAVEAPWPVRLAGLSGLVVLPFSFLRQILAGFGVELDLAWIFLPIALSGFIPIDSSR